MPPSGRTENPAVEEFRLPLVAMYGVGTVHFPDSVCGASPAQEYRVRMRKLSLGSNARTCTGSIHTVFPSKEMGGAWRKARSLLSVTECFERLKTGMLKWSTAHSRRRNVGTFWSTRLVDERFAPVRHSKRTAVACTLTFAEIRGDGR